MKQFAYVISIVMLILLSGCQEVSRSNDQYEKTEIRTGEVSDASSATIERLQKERAELLLNLSDSKKLTQEYKKKFFALNDEFHTLETSHEEIEKELYETITYGYIEEFEKGLVEMNNNYYSALQAIAGDNWIYSSESINGIHLNMPYYAIEGFFTSGDEVEMIMSVEDKYYLKKTFDDCEILMNPLMVVSVKCWGEDNPSGFDFNIGDEFDEVLSYCNEHYDKVITSNSGELFNWFHLTEDTCLILTSDIELSNIEQEESSIKAMKLEQIEICYIRTYN